MPFNTFAFLLTLLLASGTATSQSVPPLMNYQGNLTNATGQPLATGQYTLTFNVYDVPTGGAAVWGPQAITADVIGGYFNVVLSVDSTGGDSIATAFTAQPRYVSIRVDAGAEILPRQQVLSAPFAIQAGRAASADVATSTVGTSNVFPGTGNVGIGTTTPANPLTVTGESQFNGNVAITGSTNVTGSFSAGNATIGGSIVAENLQARSQKLCRAGINERPYLVHLVPVPGNWTRQHCQSLASTYQGNNYALGCLFGNGTNSMGGVVHYTEVAPLPSPNCGW